VFIPYAGVLADITANHRLYASYTTIFLPQNAQDRNFVQLDPIRGKSYEVGLKSAFFNEALQTSVALFRIEQDNLAQIDGAPITR
ncbi:TonB-dependent receptor, partial [Acinetobacter baumannii]